MVVTHSTNTICIWAIKHYCICSSHTRDTYKLNIRYRQVNSFLWTAPKILYKYNIFALCIWILSHIIRYSCTWVTLTVFLWAAFKILHKYNIFTLCTWILSHVIRYSYVWVSDEIHVSGIIWAVCDYINTFVTLLQH